MVRLAALSVGIRSGPAAAPLPERDRPLKQRRGILPLLSTLREAEADLLARHPAINSVPYNGLAESLSQSLYLNSDGALREMQRTQASLYLYAKAEETGRKPRSSGAVRLALGSGDLALVEEHGQRAEAEEQPPREAEVRAGGGGGRDAARRDEQPSEQRHEQVGDASSSNWKVKRGELMRKNE